MLAEATIDANREMQIALKGSDFREGVASFVEKRAPKCTGKLGLVCRPVFALRATPGTTLRPSAITWLRHAKPEGRSVVEPGGIEPPTSSLRTTRSPS